jgi:hypothetical protein
MSEVASGSRFGVYELKELLGEGGPAYVRAQLITRSARIMGAERRRAEALKRTRL